MIFSSWSMGQRSFKSYQLNGQNLEITTSDGKVVLRPFDRQIIETQFYPNGVDVLPLSEAVIMAPNKVEVSAKDNGTSISFQLEDGIKAEIKKKPFHISYFYNQEKILSESKGYFDADTLKGFKFEIQEDEALYGGGERALDLDRRGHRLPLYNRAHYANEEFAIQMNYGMPLIISSKKYALLYDNAPIGFIDVGERKSNELSFETIGGRSCYVVVAGSDFKDLLYQFTTLTGRQPLPPRWMFGNFSSRFGYHTEEEVLSTIAEFRKQEVPVDAIILDLYWFGPDVKGSMGTLDWYKPNFPHPTQMIDSLKKEGVKTVLITEPFITTTSGKWDEAVEKGVLAKDKFGKTYVYDFFFGETGLVDVFDPKAEDWFWNIYKGLVDQGVTGWWGDLGEPEVHPTEIMHKTGTADELHNVYGHQWAKVIYDGYKKDFPTERPFILMRSGYVGSQRYGMVPWSGDVNRTFGGLTPQSQISMTMGLSGVPYMHSDLGGFVNSDLTQEEVTELYIRWLEYGVFQPVYRPHAQEAIPSEVIFYKGEAHDIVKKYIEYRYKMLPYNYTLAYENAKTGIPLLRPLFMEETDNPELKNISDTYMWGDAYVVAPITKKGQRNRKLYLPKGNNWYHLWTGKSFKGGEWVTVDAPLDQLPVFVKGGSIIPLASKKLQTIEDYHGEEITLQIWRDNSEATTSRTIYDDDGITSGNIENKNFQLIDVMSEVSKKGMTVSLALSGNYSGAPKTREITLEIHNVDHYPKSVGIGKKKQPTENCDMGYDKKNKVLYVTIHWDGTDQKVYIIDGKVKKK
ncbi:TIM-barrel domain-containing protein [Flammeovirga sp. SubArs3]|uniref:glycoside hydrolase family 31 protein n=1 Tax=Flammeovirga sp. SubArs3 TaxID=2995316 RepID=UPI00248AAFAF|nr:TIM-barrel domain-containing protein [Flammeovirga sp. SubArs3]